MATENIINTSLTLQAIINDGLTNKKKTVFSLKGLMPGVSELTLLQAANSINALQDITMTNIFKTVESEIY